MILLGFVNINSFCQQGPDDPSNSIPKEISNKLKWLHGTESPFNISVFDSRAFALSMVSVTRDPDVAERYNKLIGSNGKEFIEKHPDSMRGIDFNNTYKLAEPFVNGPVFVSGRMEEKWNIYLWDESLYLVRSWTGALIYRVYITLTANSLAIRKIEYDGAHICSDNDAMRAVDFLIKSHLLRSPAVAPLPDDAPRNEIGIAMYLFGEYGRLGFFASKENTIDAVFRK